MRRARVRSSWTAAFGLACAVGVGCVAACGAPPFAHTPALAPPASTTAPVPAAPPSSADAAAPSSTTSASPPPNESVEARAARLHREAIVVDGHDDIPTIYLATGIDLGDPQPKTQTDLPRMKAGGITAAFFSIYVPGDVATRPSPRTGGGLRRAIDLVDATYRQVERHPDALVLGTSAEDIRRAKRDGKIAVMMGVEGGLGIEGSLGALRTLHRLGCRYLTLTHKENTEWADSSGASAPRHHGLSKFGEEVVREMQRIGMLVDVSHVSDETFASVLKVAKAPVIASHSSSRAIAAHPRNLSDDMLRALAKNGGIAMVNFWSMFLSNEFAVASAKWNARNGKAWAEIKTKHRNDPFKLHDELAKLMASTDPLPKVPLSVLVDHIDHMVKVAGVDHVGLGSDFDGVDDLPAGIAGIDGLPKITLELVKRGYDDASILKILGGNFLRVFEEAERYAKATKTTLSGDGSQAKID